ncbi:MAG: 6-phosphofructokinase 1, partial [Psychromonas sp.]
LSDQGGRCIGVVNSQMVHYDIIDCINNMKRPFNQELFDLSESLF